MVHLSSDIALVGHTLFARLKVQIAGAGGPLHAEPKSTPGVWISSIDACHSYRQDEFLQQRCIRLLMVETLPIWVGIVC